MSKRGSTSYQDDYSNDIEVTVSSSGNDCSKLSFTAPVQDIQQPAFSKLVFGGEYSIKLDDNIPKVYNHENDICGTIVSLKISDLIKCLQSKQMFNAKIIELKGVICTVLVKAV